MTDGVTKAPTCNAASEPSQVASTAYSYHGNGSRTSSSAGISVTCNPVHQTTSITPGQVASTATGITPDAL